MACDSLNPGTDFDCVSLGVGFVQLPFFQLGVYPFLLAFYNIFGCTEGEGNEEKRVRKGKLKKERGNYSKKEKEKKETG